MCVVKQYIRRKLSLFCGCLLLILIIFGCGRKGPVGYSIIEERGGEVRDTSITVVVEYDTTYSIFKSTASSPYLFVGKEEGFEARSLLYFEIPDTILIIDTLIFGLSDIDSIELALYDVEGTGDIAVCRIAESWSTDSISWLMKDTLPWDTSGGDIAETITYWTIEEEDTFMAALPRTAIDTTNFDANVVSIMLLPAATPQNSFMLSFSSLNSYDDDWPYLILAMHKDTIDTTYQIYPTRDAFIDTSSYALSEDFIMVETGSHVTRCSLSFVVDLDTLAKISSAKLSMRIESVYDSANIVATHLDTISNTTITSSADSVSSADSLLSVDIASIVQKWLKNKQYSLEFKASTETSEITRVVMDPVKASLYIVYTLPPQGRFK
jgi:hypothetical protein